MKENWKSNIGSQFAEKGIYRLEYMNKKLYNDCKEYCDYLSGFHDIRAKISTLNYGDVDEKNAFHPLIEKSKSNKIVLITVEFGWDICNAQLHEAPFKIGLVFTGNDGLYIKYLTEYSLDKDFEGLLTNKKEEISPYMFKEEKLKEAEIFEEDYVFQLINNRLLKYMENSV